MKYRLVETSLAGEIRIHRGKLIVGIIRHKSLFQDAYGEFLGTMLRFRRKSILAKEVELWDIEGKKQLGTIVFQEWGKKIKIRYADKTYDGQLSTTTNEWIVDDTVEELTFICPPLALTEGEFEQNYMEPAVVLSALYVRKQYRLYRYMITLMAVSAIVGIGVLVAINLL
jgi:hypothetical protein